MPKSRLSAFLSLLLVFLSGAAVGALAHKLYVVNTVVAFKRPTVEEVRKRQIAEMRDKVKLDDGQVAQYNAILDETRDAWGPIRERQNAEGKAIHDRQLAKVKALLRPDQLPLYEKLQAEHEAARLLRQQQNVKK